MKDSVLNALKFIGFILLIPVVYAAIVSFGTQLLSVSSGDLNILLAGVIAYLVLHLFFCELQNVYLHTKNLMLGMFGSVGPVAVFMGSLAIYSFLLLLIYFFIQLGYKEEWVKAVFLFLASFCFTLHMIFVAKDRRDIDSNAVRPHYLFAVSLIFLVNMSIIVLLLGLVFSSLSPAEFFKGSYMMTKDIYWAIFKQLFL